MVRKFYIWPLTVIALQILAIFLFGTSPAGSLLTNLLQILASGLATVACVRASLRAKGMARPFWWLLGCGMAGWAVANLGWMYYDNWLHIETPQFSGVRFLFNFHPVFYAIALFLNKDKDSREFDWETVLDSVQVGLVFFSVFFGLYYMHQMQGALSRDDDLVLERIFGAVNLALAGVAAIQWITARRPRIRSIYSAAALFLFVYFLGSYLAEYAQTVRHLPTGTWFDFGWLFPFLLAAVLADRWEEPAELPAPRLAPAKTLGRMSLKNIALASPPLIVLILVSQFGPGWRRIGYSLVGVSIFCYAVRLGISQYRESHSEETVRHHTLAMETAVEGMAILSATGQFTYMNSSHARLFGYSNGSELLGKSWHVLYQREEVARFEKEVMPKVFGEGGWSGEATALRRDGTLFPQELSLTRLNDGGLVCVCRDITERLNAARARSDAEAKYRSLIEQVAAISYIAEVGINGEWHYVSPQIGSILGYTPEEWLDGSRDWLRHVYPEDHSLVEAAEAASGRGERFQAEYRMIRKDGQAIWVSDTAVVVCDPQGHSLMEGIIVDITERKQLELQLQQSRRMEAVGRLAGGIAHDFNNLLTIIKGYTELALTRTGILPEVRADVVQIEGASERAVTLVRQLLAFSRKQILKPKVLDLNSVVLGLDNLLRRLMSEDIEMQTMVGKDVGAVKADPGQIEQVIMNLVVNAREAMPNGGRLVIETANADLDDAYARDHVSVKPGNYVMLAVSDTGVGIEADALAHIFEPFYTTKASGKGTGLGLSTVYGIVKQSGGYIWVYSEPGRGSSFKVYLPRVGDPVDLPGQSAKPTTARRGTETILLVEDEPAVRELTRMVLAKQGYSVVEAINPEEAERLCENGAGEIHLLLTDVIMPGVSGHELAKRITARHPKIKVLYMSGYTHNVIASGGMLDRGIAFLQKPFTPATLIEKVRDVLDGVPASG